MVIKHQHFDEKQHLSFSTICCASTFREESFPFEMLHCYSMHLCKQKHNLNLFKNHNAFDISQDVLFVSKISLRVDTATFLTSNRSSLRYYAPYRCKFAFLDVLLKELILELQKYIFTGTGQYGASHSL